MRPVVGVEKVEAGVKSCGKKVMEPSIQMQFKIGKEMSTGKGRSDSKFPGKIVSAAVIPASGKRDLRDIIRAHVAL